VYQLIDLMKSDLEKDEKGSGTVDQYSLESIRRQEIRQIVNLCTSSTGPRTPSTLPLL
jgi:hypothetical protein